MKLYIIAEDHEKDEVNRKGLIPLLLDTDNYIVGREGMLFGCMANDGTYGL